MDTQQAQVTTEIVFDYIQHHGEELTPIDSVMQQFDLTLYQARRLVKDLLLDGRIDTVHRADLAGRAIRGYRAVATKVHLQSCVGY